MPLKVQKVAAIVGSEIVLETKTRSPGDFAAFLTNCEPSDDPGPGWSLTLVIGEKPKARSIKIEIAPSLSATTYAESSTEPVMIGRCEEPYLRDVLLFRGRFFLTERPILLSSERDEAMLRVKKVVYGEEAELTALMSAVSNMEAAIVFQRTGPRRDPIPEDVKLVVWSRDGGACVRCGLKEKLHFDHIIPVAKGGGDSAANIQLLCERCNLTKSDKIAF